MPSRRLAACLVGAAMLAACSGSDPKPTPSPTSPTPIISPSPFKLPPCRQPKEIPFPDWVPEDLPLPKGIYHSQALPRTAGYFRGLFVLPLNTTQMAKFVLKRWPEAGYQLGRGDAEPGEIEDQFLKPPAVGAFKAQDVICKHPYSIMLLIYVPDRSKIQVPGTQPGSPLPSATTTPSPSASPSATA